MKTLLCDIDGVLNDIQEHFITYIEKFGYKFNYDYCDQYDMSKGIVTDRKTQKMIIRSIFTNDYFWKTIPVASNAVTGLKFLNDEYNLFIATTPYDKHNEQVKIEWVNRHFPFIDTKQIIFSDSKWLLDGDIIIEDKPSTLECCVEHGFITVKKVQPYNLLSNCNYELHNWNEIELLSRLL